MCLDGVPHTSRSGNARQSPARAIWVARLEREMAGESKKEREGERDRETERQREGERARERGERERGRGRGGERGRETDGREREKEMEGGRKGRVRQRVRQSKRQRQRKKRARKRESVCVHACTGHVCACDHACACVRMCVEPLRDVTLQWLPVVKRPPPSGRFRCKCQRSYTGRNNIFHRKEYLASQDYGRLQVPTLFLTGQIFLPVKYNIPSWLNIPYRRESAPALQTCARPEAR